MGGVFSTPEHLGGFTPGGDEATWYPALWTWLVEELEVESVLDVGCGEGQAVDYFHKVGAHAFGIDGVRQPNDWIAAHDFTTGPFLPWHSGDISTFDLVWCCEFVEHVEERYIPNFLDAFTHGDLVLMTHADLGQAGHHHVNCQPSAYWIGAMAAIGYRLDTELMMQTRALAGVNPNPWNHYVRSGLAFRRYD